MKNTKKNSKKENKKLDKVKDKVKSKKEKLNNLKVKLKLTKIKLKLVKEEIISKLQTQKKSEKVSNTDKLYASEVSKPKNKAVTQTSVEKPVIKSVPKTRRTLVNKKVNEILDPKSNTTKTVVRKTAVRKTATPKLLVNNDIPK